MQGFIVITAETGRALRDAHAALPAAAVLDCAGGFNAGDRVYVVTRGRDGGQGVLATGTVRCDAASLKRGVSESGERVVMGLHDVELLWKSGA